LRAAGHGEDREGSLFRPIRNRTSKEGDKAAIWTDSLWRILTQYAKAAGIKMAGFGPHTLRATAATNALIERGILKVVPVLPDESPAIVTTDTEDFRIHRRFGRQALSTLVPAGKG
jgi:integrase